jgi:hypothetical protein
VHHLLALPRSSAFKLELPQIGHQQIEQFLMIAIIMSSISFMAHAESSELTRIVLRDGSNLECYCKVSVSELKDVHHYGAKVRLYGPKDPNVSDPSIHVNRNWGFLSMSEPDTNGEYKYVDLADVKQVQFTGAGFTLSNDDIVQAWSDGVPATDADLKEDSATLSSEQVIVEAAARVRRLAAEHSPAPAPTLPTLSIGCLLLNPSDEAASSGSPKSTANQPRPKTQSCNKGDVNKFKAYRIAYASWQLDNEIRKAIGLATSDATASASTTSSSSTSSSSTVPSWWSSSKSKTNTPSWGSTTSHNDKEPHCISVPNITGPTLSYDRYCAPQ